MSNIQYKGARWFKCDLHLHTPASACFLDKTVTAEQGVQSAIDAGLQCVAVTDHNTGKMIDEIKEEAAKKNLFVFPGVEITCDTSKIHLLVLFNADKTTQNIEDFLIRCGIERSSFSKSDAHSSKSAIEIANLANEFGALVIPAHIDEFNGLAYLAGSTQFANFINLPYIYGVQFVHKEFLNPNLKVKNNSELLEAINSHYGNGTRIGEDNIRMSYANMKEAQRQGVQFLTFSDNPDVSDPSKHGLSGIGKYYSWIKMDSHPTLESLKQALLMPSRTHHCFECLNVPYKTPSLWIKQITIQNTSLTKDNEAFKIEFNPQLNTIIGGRGSGKSSILRFLRGVFNNTIDLDGLTEIKQDQNDFFKITDSNKKGVLKSDTIIEVYFIRDGIEYKITYNQATQNRKVESFDYESSGYKVCEGEGFIDFFKTEQYSQKQIYSIAQSTNSLRNRIDDAIPEVARLKTDIDQLRQNYKSVMSRQRAIEQTLKNKGRLITEIKDLNNKISLLKQSGIADVVSKRQEFVDQMTIIRKNIDIFGEMLNPLEDACTQLTQLPPFCIDGISDEYREEINNLFDEPQQLLQRIIALLNRTAEDVKKLMATTKEKLAQTKLYSDFNANDTSFIQKKEELESKGIPNISEFEQYLQQISEKETELKMLENKSDELIELKNNSIQIKESLFAKRRELTTKRINFISGINTSKVEAKVNPYADKANFIDAFRKIIQKTNSYEDDIKRITDDIFPNGNFNNANFDSFKSKLLSTYNRESNDSFGGRFNNVIHELNAEQIDDIDLLLPEDDIIIRYKNRNNSWTPLSIASAGQKTTAILTFILSFGDKPLILDQPEDDLDNKLVYDLIVEKMREIKEKRQVIVVTHNANIPVNGDAEYVVSLSASSKKMSVQVEGTIENPKVKDEICDVMEGGKEAFDIRAKRYSV